MSPRGGRRLSRRAERARWLSPARPSGDERSRNWALRVEWIADAESPAGWRGISPGAKGGSLVIMDRETGATGRFALSTVELNVDIPFADLGPGGFAAGTGWKDFRTVDAITLWDFQDIVRTPSFGVDFLGISLNSERIAFSTVDIDKGDEPWWDWGDDVDIADVTAGIGVGASLGLGVLKLQDLEWRDPDVKANAHLVAQDVAAEVAVEMNAYLDKLADALVSSQLPDDVDRTPEAMADWVDGESVLSDLPLPDDDATPLPDGGFSPLPDNLGPVPLPDDAPTGPAAGGPRPADGPVPADASADAPADAGE